MYEPSTLRRQGSDLQKIVPHHFLKSFTFPFRTVALSACCPHNTVPPSCAPAVGVRVWLGLITSPWTPYILSFTSPMPP